MKSMLYLLLLLSSMLLHPMEQKNFVSPTNQNTPIIEYHEEVEDLQNSCSNLITKLEPHRQDNFISRFKSWVFGKDITIPLIPSSPRSVSKEEFQQNVVRDFQAFLDTCIVMATPKEEIDAQRAEYSTQLKLAQLAEDAEIIKKSQLHKFLQHKKIFMREASLAVLIYKLRGLHKRLARLPSHIRKPTLSSAIAAAAESLFQKIKTHIEYQQENILKNISLSTPEKEYKKQELEVSYEFFKTRFKEEKDKNQKNILGQVSAMTEKALHACEEKCLTAQILGEVTWTFWSNLCIQIQDHLNIDLNDEQIFSYKEIVVDILQYKLLELWCQCVQNSALGLKNEGLLPKKFKKEEEKDRVYKQQLKAQGKTIKSGVDRDGIRYQKQPTTNIENSEEKKATKEETKQFLTAHFLKKIEDNISKSQRKPKAPRTFKKPQPSSSFAIKDLLTEIQSFQLTKIVPQQETEETTALIISDPQTPHNSPERGYLHDDSRTQEFSTSSNDGSEESHDRQFHDIAREAIKKLNLI